jgi:hypothetical protein
MTGKKRSPYVEPCGVKTLREQSKRLRRIPKTVQEENPM